MENLAVRVSAMQLWFVVFCFFGVDAFASGYCAQVYRNGSVNQRLLSGKRALVTGATLGIGRETALALAQQGAEVVIVGRNSQKVSETVNWLKEQSNNDKIYGMTADLSLLAQVKSLAQDFKSKFDKLDILVNNAGAIFLNREMTSENIEKTWALNHLSPLLLTIELIEPMRAAGSSRVVNVASAMYEGGTLEGLNSHQSSASYKGTVSYSNSKLANVMTSSKLTQVLKNFGININLLHPGFVDTGIGLNNKGFMGLLLKAAAPARWLMLKANKMVTPKEGAAVSIYLASSPEMNETTGQFFMPGPGTPKSVAMTELSRNESEQNKIFELSIRQIREKVSLEFPEGDL
jgi:retinol dehydrogenase-12